MRAKQILGPLLGYAMVLLFLACSGKETPDIPKETVFKDSISYWLSRKNAPEKLAHSQNLKKALAAVEKEPSDSLKTKYASQLSLKFYGLKDSLYFRKANTLALYWATKTQDSANIAAAYWDAGDFYKYNGVADSAYYMHSAAHEIYKDLKNDFYAGRMLQSMASAQITIKDFTAAETYLIEAIKLFKPLKKYDRLYGSYNSLGIVSNNLREYDKALEYHQQALDYLKKVKKKGILEAYSKNNIGAVYLAKGKYELALEQFLAVTETDSLLFKNPALFAKALSNSGEIQHKLGYIREAEKLLKKSVLIKDSIGDLKSLSRSYFNLAELYLDQKDTLQARTHAELAMNNAQASDNNLRVLETLGLLTQIDPKNATDYTQHYITLNDSLQTAERRTRNKFERIRFETNETLAENALLARQKQLWIGIATALLLLAISIYIMIDQRRKNEKLRFQEEQQASNQKIFNMLLSEKTNIEEGKKQAQKRISEELHDSVQGRIQGIRMLLLGLNKRTTPDAVEMRGNAITELQDVQEEVRAISHELSNAAYQKIYSFIVTIQELLNETEKSAGLKSSFEFDEEVEWDNLSGDVKINVFRVIQESLQNCVKHAQAKTIALSFAHQSDGQLHITIKDDGKGFKVKGGKKGIGMRNIGSRLEKLGGSWEINSEIGEGTTVILYIPTNNEEQNPKLTPEKIPLEV